jgi:hypothetical protein
MHGLVPHLVNGHDKSPPSATVLIEGGRTHVVCQSERLSAFELRAEERGYHAHRLWYHTCDGRVVSVAPLGHQRVAVLLEVEGEARLDIVDQHGVRSIASAKDRPTALASIGATLAFSTADADGAAKIRVVTASSGRVVNTLDAPFVVDEITADPRLRELLVFGRGANWICRIPIDDPCVVGVAAQLRVALMTGAMVPSAIPSTTLGSAALAVQRKPSCCCGHRCACCDGPPNGGGGGHEGGGGPTGGGRGPGGGGAGGQPSDHCLWCLPGGPGITDGCYLFIVVDGRRIVRIDLCHPGLPPCAIMVDRPVERIVKAGVFLVAQGDSGRYMAQIDPATMTIVQARAFPRGGAIVVAHPASSVVVLFDRRVSAWYSLDLSAAPPSRALKVATPGRTEPSTIPGGP